MNHGLVRRLGWTVLFDVVLAGGAAGQQPERVRLVRQIDSLAAAALASGPTAGLAIAVVKGRDTIVAKGYGLADLENDVPATAQTVYRIGSITKQFTAAAIMQLVEAGRVSLDDELTKFLPAYPTAGHRVTVRHLLTHTSGIKSYTGLGAEFWEKSPLDLTHDQLLALFQDKPFDFAPGERFLYNNSGYYLLGVILEKVTGRPYGDYVRERLAAPLGLGGTLYCDESPLVKRRARGYARAEGKLVNARALSMKPPFSAGALCSTVLDLVAWTTALAGGRVVSPQSYALMTTAGRLNDGASTNYGFGLAPGALEGHSRVGHGGGINGFNTHLDHYPGDGLIVVVLANTEGANPARLAERIARLVLGMPRPAVNDLPLTPADRARARRIE
jgi:CubicO group peptidase (beta-lactamase class C family)